LLGKEEAQNKRGAKRRKKDVQTNYKTFSINLKEFDRILKKEVIKKIIGGRKNG